MNKVQSAQACIENIKGKTSEAIVMLSFGKDSLVTLDMIYPQFKTLHCVFMYFVKDLEHIQRWINWVQVRYPRINFHQVPHWTLTYTLRYGLYCVPDPKVKLLTLSDVCKAMRKKFGCDYVFLGMKKADSMNRRLMLMGYQKQKYENNGFVYPLADWTQKEVLAYMKQHNLPEPVIYGTIQGSGVGFSVDCFKWMRDNCPNDLQKFYKAYPMSERILMEEDYKNGINRFNE